MDFFGGLGFTFNMDFTNEKAACMIINENAYVMLLQEDFFRTFTKNDLVDATKNTEVITALSAGNKEKLNEMVDKAISMGAREARDPQDHGFMYDRSFHDLDGHIWEVFWMDMNAIPQP